MTGGEVKFGNSALSVISVFFLALLIFTFASTAPVVSPVYAENGGGGPLPVDSVADTTSTPSGSEGSGESSLVDLLVTILNAVL